MNDRNHVLFKKILHHNEGKAFASSTPFLVELSSRTKTTEENMAFFKPDVVFCPKASDLVLCGVQGGN
jgi:hypothetical protein